MHIRWRGLELPGSVVVDQKTLTPTYGKFVAEPFERGFGTTVGNSLRRVLLSSLEGSAVTQIKLAGALHEFTTIKGVLEDVTDVVLAVKSLIVKNHSESTRVLRVEKSTKGPVTGADVQTDDAVEVVNKDLVLATLTDDVPFELEMVVENGRGYVPSSEHSQASQEIGIIPVDAVFSPVTRVKYEVEETRVGQKTNYDKLTMEIWTNGTVTPEMALVEAAKILRKHLNPFVGYTRPGPAVNLPAAGDFFAALKPSLEGRLGMLVSQLGLSQRAANSLEAQGIGTVRELVSRGRDEVAAMWNLGDATLQEIESKLRELDLEFGMSLPLGAGA
jgi:DNA-directed RNA polymerase subunit alpha